MIISGMARDGLLIVESAKHGCLIPAKVLFGCDYLLTPYTIKICVLEDMINPCQMCGFIAQIFLTFAWLHKNKKCKIFIYTRFLKATLIHETSSDSGSITTK